MDERMTICNMSIEGGARVGYVNPDETTFDYLEGPAVRARGRGVRRARRRGGDRSPRMPTPSTTTTWRSSADELTPVVTWGVNPGPVDRRRRPRAVGRRAGRRRRRRSPTRSATWACEPGSRSPGMKVDVAFIGSCTNCAAVRPARGGARRPGPPRRAAREGAGRARVRRRSRAGRRARRARRDLPRRRLRMARRRLLDVPGHEPGQARGRPGLRVLVEPQLQGPAGQPDRAHAADEPGDGRRGRDRRRGDRRAGRSTRSWRG